MVTAREGGHPCTWHRALLLLGALLALVLDAPTPGGARVQFRPRCSSLPVAVDWALELCKATAQLRLRRLDGCPAPAPPLRSGTAPRLLHLALAQGPDELLVLLEGAEFHALEGVHLGGCEYTFALPQPLLGGVYRVAIVLHREGWAALTEAPGAREAFPPLVGSHLASCLVRLGPEGSDEALENARMAVLGRGGGYASSSLPRCNTSAALFGPGRWVRTREAVGMFGGEGSSVPGSPPLRGWYAAPERAPYTSGLLLYTEVERDLTWVPYACALVTAPAHSLAALARRCLSGASLSFQGDSQLRTMYNDILQRHCGINNAAAKGLVHDVCVGRSSGTREALQGLSAENGTCPLLASCFLSDPWGAQPPSSSTEGAEVVVVNLGQHSAARHEPLADFFARVESYMAAAARGINGSRQRLLMVEAQPFPVRYGDGGVLKYADGRTQPRLRLYNSVAARAAAAAEGQGVTVEVVHTWDISIPMVDACPDGSHFNGVFNVLDALGGRLLGALCPNLPV